MGGNLEIDGPKLPGKKTFNVNPGERWKASQFHCSVWIILNVSKNEFSWIYLKLFTYYQIDHDSETRNYHANLSVDLSVQVMVFSQVAKPCSNSIHNKTVQSFDDPIMPLHDIIHYHIRNLDLRYIPTKWILHHI